MPVHRNEQGVVIRIYRFSRLDRASRERLGTCCSSSGISNPGYVIFAGPDEGTSDDRRTPLLMYRAPDAAFVVPRSPIVLSVRGEVWALKKGEIYFIPSRKAGFPFWKIAAAAVLLLLCMAAGLYYFLNVDSDSSMAVSEKLAHILEEGYQGIHELPEEYLKRLPGWDGEILYADASEAEIDDYLKRANGSLDLFIFNIAPMVGGDRRLIAFLCFMVNDERYSLNARCMALHALFNAGSCHDIPELILMFRDHADHFVRYETDIMIRNNPALFEGLVNE
jgi:hypothetical protein